MPSEVSHESTQIKQNDKFFTRIMSKETSMANSSCRVYYGGASGAIPFMWESRPGTPKHTLADTSIPPLTPPPSYHSTLKSNPTLKNVRPNLLTTVFHRLTPKRTRMSPSSSLSSTSSWSSSCSSPSNFLDSKSKTCYVFSCKRSPSCYRVDDDEHRLRSTLCHDIKRKSVNGHHLMGNLKNAVLSLIRHGSSG
ncbi:hypothetical protein SADUNF_Sadunf19G0054800 [Salix dunnii]|uniref:Uncharacterized protein n=1 Tax=Salix dunnii TaxID=1413687 RepID=A0A835MCL0_9ROSI|nr:hypothetical protein SADUNF_Sadunf19G0054800 [Salix dunnii]